MSSSTVFLAAAFALLSLVSASIAQVNVLTYHNDNARTGANLQESQLTLANVNSNTFGKLFQYNVDGHVYAQPLYVSGVNIPGLGPRNVIFVATQHNSVYALDADSPSSAGGLIWQVNLGPSAATPNHDFGTRYGGFTAIVPEVGITGTPVIDLASGTLYVDAFTHEGTAYFHRMHALNITNGAQRPFSPVLVNASMPGVGVGSSNGVLGFDPKQHLHRSALTLAGGRVYAAYAGYDDTDPYHGWVIGFNATNLQQLPNYTFNTTPNATVAQFGVNAGEGGIWMSGCGLSVDAAGSLYFASGNGSFNALNNSGGTEYGDTFFRLSTTSGLAVADYFTPYNQASLAANDIDVGSGGLMLLPDQPGPFPRLFAAGGKEGKVYLISRDMFTAGNNHYNAGGSGDAILQTIARGRPFYATPAYYNGRVILAAAGDVMIGYTMNNGMLSNLSISTRTCGYPGATPSISANGTGNGIAWAIARADPAILTAFNATNLAMEIYNSSQAGNRDQLTNGIKFAVPSVVNGKVYVGGQYALAVFGLLPVAGPPYTAWKVAHFGADADNPAIAGNTADPDGDKIINVMEYAHAFDPMQFTTNRATIGMMVTNRFQVQFRRNTSATDLTYFVQMASTVNGTFANAATYQAGTWTTNTAGITISESAPTGQSPDRYVTVTVRAPVTMPAQPMGFFRVIVSISV